MYLSVFKFVVYVYLFADVCECMPVCLLISSIESQKGLKTCLTILVENQKAAMTAQSLW